MSLRIEFFETRKNKHRFWAFDLWCTTELIGTQREIEKFADKKGYSIYIHRSAEKYWVCHTWKTKGYLKRVEKKDKVDRLRDKQSPLADKVKSK